MFSTPYDYNSIMHYSSKAFAKDRKKETLIPLQSALHMGQREGTINIKNKLYNKINNLGMSVGDILRLNRMYKCGDAHTKGLLPPQPKKEENLPKQGENQPKEVKTEEKIKTNSTEIKEKPKTIFGILIFRSSG